MESQSAKFTLGSLVTVLAFVCASAADVQATEITVGGTMGGGISFGKERHESNYNSPSDHEIDIYAPVPAVSIGTSINIYASNYWGMQTGIQWSTRGFEDSTDLGTAYLKIQQIGIPIYLLITNDQNSNLFFAFKLGAESAIRNKCIVGLQANPFFQDVRIDCDSPQLEALRSTFNLWEFSPSAGISLGHRLKNRSIFRADLAYYHGISSYFKEFDLYTRSILLQVSYDFLIKRTN